MSGILESGRAESLQNGVEVEKEINGNIPDGMENIERTKEIRIIKKAKRPSRQSPGKETISSLNGEIKVNNKLPYAKNSKKSRAGLGRGLPKKGGAGGKGTWGQPGDEIYEDGQCRDHNDPNYDSDSQDEYIVEKTEPEVTSSELQNIVDPVIHEYFEHGDTTEVGVTLDGLNLGLKKHKILELAVNIALDHKATQREMTSILISDLYGKILNGNDVERGFDQLLSSLSDLTLDTPDAPLVVGQFMARAVADDCLAPKYIMKYKGNADCPLQRQALDKADLLLTKNHGIVRLDNIWGTGGGIRPVKALITQINLLLKEYLSSGDIMEATRCLQELDVPHFHHEVVYEATVMVLEDSSERSEDRMCKLLKSFSDTVIITPEQFTQGFQRVYDFMPDINLDVPEAYTLLERFAEKCLKNKTLSPDLYKELPQRGRKRFVSEGDGGRIKEHAI